MSYMDKWLDDASVFNSKSKFLSRNKKRKDKRKLYC